MLPQRPLPLYGNKRPFNCVVRQNISGISYSVRGSLKSGLSSLQDDSRRLRCKPYLGPAPVHDSVPHHRREPCDNIPRAIHPSVVHRHFQVGDISHFRSLF